MALSASLTPYVPKYAIEPANKFLASSEVAVAGALDAIFGRSGRANMRKKRPFASKRTIPFGLVPYDWTLLPFGRVLPGGERPGSDKLVLERPLLADGAVG